MHNARVLIAVFLHPCGNRPAGLDNCPTETSSAILCLCHEPAKQKIIKCQLGQLSTHKFGIDNIASLQKHLIIDNSIHQKAMKRIAGCNADATRYYRFLFLKGVVIFNIISYFNTYNCDIFSNTYQKINFLLRKHF